MLKELKGSSCRRYVAMVEWISIEFVVNRDNDLVRVSGVVSFGKAWVINW